MINLETTLKAEIDNVKAEKEQSEIQGNFV